MSGVLRQMVSCHWTARRIQRYLDADPSGPLTPGEVIRLEEHVAMCDRCSEVMRQHRLLHRALSMWPGAHPVEPGSVDRMRTVLDELIDGRKA